MPLLGNLFKAWEFMVTWFTWSFFDAVEPARSPSRGLHHDEIAGYVIDFAVVT